MESPVTEDFKHQVLVFLVEDSDMYALMLEHTLKKKGNYVFKKFAKGEDCIEHMHLNPDIIILDYNLNGIDGLETLKKIKKINYSTPVVIISAQQDLKIAIDMFGAGAFEYIPKDSDTIYVLSKTIARISLLKALS